jgi:hypothetical protein
MRKVQLSGPYFLLGWSFGRKVAHTIACPLQLEHEQVALLAILDAYPAELDRIGSKDHDAEFSLDEIDAQGVFKIVKERMLLFKRHFSGNAAVFCPSKFDGDMLIFATTENIDLCDTWTPYVSGHITSRIISCRHREMGRPGPMTSIGWLLRRYLENSGLPPRARSTTF